MVGVHVDVNMIMLADLEVFSMHQFCNFKFAMSILGAVHKPTFGWMVRALLPVPDIFLCSNTKFKGFLLYWLGTQLRDAAWLWGQFFMCSSLVIIVSLVIPFIAL